MVASVSRAGNGDPSKYTVHLSLSLEIVKFLAKKPWSANPLLEERRDCADSGQKKGKPQGGVAVRVWAKNGWRRGRWWIPLPTQ
jgi:hypothetical protein